jgi:transcriptional regulator with PAS, ATPase and Fis domain
MTSKQRNGKEKCLAEWEWRAHLLDDALQALPQTLRIVDRELNLIYANHSADGVASVPGTAPTRKCYQLLGRYKACEECPIAGDSVSSAEPYALIVETEKSHGSASMCNVLARLHGLQLAKAVSVDTNLPVEAPVLSSEEDRLGNLIGRSEPMRRLFEMINMVSASGATVLLEGESGTGKEVVARTIHTLSRRHDRRFVVIDCGALPDTLLESELFGHVRGAFTGAVAGKTGLFEEAEGGTIFLDEIALMSPTLQAKLLRAIQEGEIRPVGGTRNIKVDVRIIAASNQPMASLIASRAFREDLYYRLAVIPLTVPPLRDRREDIPLLVETFIADACYRHGREPVSVEADAMRLLVNHQWPGNVRELKHVIERGVLTATGLGLSASRFFTDLLGAPPSSSFSSLGDEKEGAVRFIERARIVEALKRAKGNRSEAAQLLRISRASFYNKLHKYQLHGAEGVHSLGAIRHRRQRTV